MRTGVGAGHQRGPVGKWARIAIVPTTVLGRWAVGLAIGFWALVLVATVVPGGAAIGFAFGLAGALAALLAIVRDRDRAVLVFAALVPLVVAVAFVLAELISGSP